MEIHMRSNFWTLECLKANVVFKSFSELFPLVRHTDIAQHK